MAVAPRNSPRILATKKAYTPSSTTVVVFKKNSSSSNSRRHGPNSMRRTTALCRIRILVLTTVLVVGQISLCCNLYIMLWLQPAIQTTVNHNSSNDPNNPATFVRIATEERQGQIGSKHTSIRNIWGYLSRNEDSSMDEKPRRSLSVQPDNTEKADYQQLDLDHILSKEKLSDMNLEHLKSIPIDRRANIPHDWPLGVLSEKSTSFFREIQGKVDKEDPVTRCSRYESMSYNPNMRRNRRIFFGSLIADEPWELLEIVGTETYGIFEGVVLVESNRTQSFEPRPFQRLHHGPVIQQVFGTPNVQVRAYVNERRRIPPMTREHWQREEILRGWKEMGMGPDDIGYLGDLDETFARDFLRAVQTCEVDILNYQSHQCENAKIVSETRIFEGSPECISNKGWWHPEMVIGACIDGIGDETKHPPPPDRIHNVNHHSGKGWGLNCEYDAMKQNSTLWDNRMFPLYDGADFRRRCGTRIRRRQQQQQEKEGRLLQRQKKHSTGSSTSRNSSSRVVVINGRHTAFHFHNWFATVHSIRHKYGTYGHAHQDASQRRVKDLNTDTAIMYQCALDRPHGPPSQQQQQRPNQNYSGYQRASDLIEDDSQQQVGFVPIYFQDVEYRKKRHDYLTYMIDWDETTGPGSMLTNTWDHSPTKKYERIKMMTLHGKHPLITKEVSGQH